MRVLLVILIYSTVSVCAMAQQKIGLKTHGSGKESFYFTGERPAVSVCLSGFSEDTVLNSVTVKWSDFIDTSVSRYHIYSLKKLQEKKNSEVSKVNPRDTLCKKLVFDFPEMPGVYHFQVDTTGKTVTGTRPYQLHADSTCGRYKLFINADLGNNEQNIEEKITGTGLVIDTLEDTGFPHWLHTDSLISRIKTDSVNKFFRERNKPFNDTSNHCTAKDKRFLQYAVIISNQSAKDTSFFPKYSSVSIVLDPWEKYDVSLLQEIKKAAAGVFKDFFDPAANFVDSSVLSPGSLQILRGYYDSVFRVYPEQNIYWSKGFLKASLNMVPGFNLSQLEDSCKLNYVFRRNSYMVNQLIFYGKIQIGLPTTDASLIALAALDLPPAPQGNKPAESNGQVNTRAKTTPVAGTNKDRETKRAGAGAEGVTVESINGLLTKNPRFKKDIEISGLAFKDGMFYMAEEKLGTIRCIDAGTTKEDTTKSILTGLKDKAEFEGLAIFGNYLLATNEKYLTTERVYYHDFTGHNNNWDTVGFISGKERILLDTGLAGIEGIAVDEKRSLCYLLKERNSLPEKNNHSSIIRVFGILINDQKPVLTYTRQAIIIEYESGYRYSDIYCDAGTNSIYGIRSKTGSYYIDKINLAGLFKKAAAVNRAGETIYSVSLLKSSKIVESRELSFARQDGKKDPNLEGITVSNGYIYLVSDNRDNGETRFFKTTLF